MATHRKADVGQRAAQKEKTRAKLLVAGSQLVGKVGVSRFSTKELAAMTGVSHGTVFLHFRTKEDLVVAVIDAFGTRLAEGLRALRSASTVRSVLEAHLAVVQEYESFYAVLLTEGPHLPPSVRGTLITLNAGVAVYLRDAMAKERPDCDLDRTLVFNSWMGLVSYYLMNRDLFAPDRSVIAEKGDQLIEHFLQTLGLET